MSFNDVVNKGNVIFMNIFGTIGNLSLVIMTIFSKELHFKCGYILAILSIVNLLLLWNDCQFLYIQFANITDANPLICFYYNLIYFVLQTADVSLWFITGIDRFLSIWRPFWYNSLTNFYIFWTIAPTAVICSIILVWSSFTISQAALPPACWLDPVPVVTFFDFYTNGCRIVTCLLYGIVYYRIRLLRSHKEDSAFVRKQIALVGSLIYIVALNFFLLVLTILIRGMKTVPSLDGLVAVSETLFNILVELIWAADFYVYIWRSKEYRLAFTSIILRRKQLHRVTSTAPQPLFKMTNYPSKI